MEERAGFHGYLKRTWDVAQAAFGRAWEYTPKGFGYAPLVEEAGNLRGLHFSTCSGR